jgi:hypothetical protein
MPTSIWVPIIAGRVHMTGVANWSTKVFHKFERNCVRGSEAGLEHRGNGDPYTLITLRYVGRMKRMGIRQAWREKLALDLLIWFICGRAVLVIAVLGVLICPKEHALNTSEFPSTSGRIQLFSSTDASRYHLIPYVRYADS